jgi:glutamine amidotransferase
MTTVTVVDYDSGNLLSVRRALEHCGAQVEVTDSPESVLSADRLVLPGVGAFGDAMDKLRRRNLVQHLKDFAATGRPFLGICVGMQILFDRGQEFGEQDGLGLIPGLSPPCPTPGPTALLIRFPISDGAS